MVMLRSALSKNPNDFDCLALYAWLLNLMHPSEPAPFDEMLKTLDKALADNPRSERAHQYKGIILKRMKRERDALRHFNKALEINPRNVDAAREVRIAQMRADSNAPPAPTTGSNKLLSRLRGNKGKPG
jgi:tetratricopeptide (TPR) repeat protein